MSLAPLTRRSSLALIAAAAFAPRQLLAATSEGLKAELAAIETRSKGRLGVAVLLPNGTLLAHRGDERFPLCSTFKLLAAALILHRVDQDQEQLDRAIAVRQQDILSYAPAAKQHVGGSMTVARLCEAAITLSDNTAANLLLASFGGPPALTAFLRTTGDTVTRLDRNEPTLNESIPGDPRDTTSPNAMVGSLKRLCFGDILKPASRQQLNDWMLANTTGKAKLLAGLPAGWRVADKTGSGGHGSNNDIGALYPPTGQPLLVASYLTATTLETDAANAIHAEVARAIVKSL